MSGIRAIDIEEAASTVKSGLVGVEAQIAVLNDTMKELTALIRKILEEEGI